MLPLSKTTIARIALLSSSLWMAACGSDPSGPSNTLPKISKDAAADSVNDVVGSKDGPNGEAALAEAGKSDSAPSTEGSIPDSQSGPEGGAQESGGDTETSTEPDGTVGPEAGYECPNDMLRIPGKASCIDRYEASPGGAGAASVAGALPWVNVGWSSAKAMCELAGKRLCESVEWVFACSAHKSLKFPYGNSYDPNACNTDPGGGAPVATGSLPQCEGGIPGLFDMSGNVREWVNECGTAGCSARGGAYHQPESMQECDREQSEVVADPAAIYADIGFRCCLDATPGS